ncbi:MAG: hypothetical protein E7419_07690 [Ruminococcaceae bacterium]|nr:hypothetical protein [Oscillospiraceae bacterium]
MKRILSIIIVLSFILMSVPVAYTSETSLDFIPDNNISDIETLSENNTDIYALNETYERGTFTLKEKHYLERNTGNVTFSAWKPDNFTDSISGRVYNASGDPRDEAILKFETTAEGLNADDKVILTVAVRAQTALGVSGGSVRIVGIVDENYAFNGTLPTVDRNYTFTTTEGLSLDFKEYSFDVTSYVKARIQSGAPSISFLVEFVDSDWKNGDSSVYMDLALAPYNVVPHLEYKKTILSDLSYDGNNINIKDGTYTYVVTLDDDTTVPYVSALADNSTVDIIQATQVPGTAVIKVNTYGVETQYKVNFITDDYIGTATAVGVFNATRSTTHGRFDANLTSYNVNDDNKYVQVRTDSSTKVRQEGAVVFDIENLLGIPADKKAVLTVYGYGNVAAVNAQTKVEIRGVTGEGVTAGGKYGTDVDYSLKSDIAVTSDSQTAYKFDVTDYLKSKIANSEETATFAVRVEEGGNATTFYWYYGGTRKPTITFEEISAELSDIKVDGVSVADFSSAKTDYTHLLSYDYQGIPEVTGVTKDSGATAVTEEPSSVPGIATIEVTTPGGKTKTYTVYLDRAEISTELTDIKVDGVSIDGFESSKTIYTHYLADNYQGFPAISVTKKDNVASENIVLCDTIPGTVYIDVENFSGKLTTYKIKLCYESSKTQPTTYTTLPKVTYTDAVGTVIDAVPANATVNATLDLRELRDEDNITFVTALYNDGFMIDKVSSKKQGNETSLTNTLNVTLSDVSKAQIKSFILNDYKNGNSIINCATLTSTNNNLKALSFNNSIIAGFNKSILNYKFKVPASVLNYPELLFKTEDSGVKTEITYPAKLSGTVNIKTTANNGDSKTYSVEFEREDAKVTNVTMDYASFDPNSNLKIYENIQNPIYSGANEVISEITNPILLHTGRTYLVKNMEDKFLGGTFISLPMDGFIPTTNTKMAEYLDKTGFITFDINRSATVYIAWNDVSMPAWASAEGFTEVSNATENITATSDTATMQMNKIYKKYYEVSEWSETPVTVSLGAINQHKYWWIIVVFDD